jgi:RNA polymerase sigma factor (sigma-70 family)
MESRDLAELVGAASGGDQQAWEGLVHRFGGLVWSVARAHGLSAADAADVSQTAWLRLVEHLDRIRDPERVGTWLASTARHEALRVLRRAGRELVLEYAHWHAAEYEIVWWIPAQRTTTAVAALGRLARQLGLQEQADQDEMVAELFGELRLRDRWLLIYDDAETPKQLEPLLPPGGGGHVLVTSRNPTWGRVAKPLPLAVLRREESVALLGRRAGIQDVASAATLAEFLGDLPLALEEAAAYIDETKVGLTDYLRLARERTVELFGLDRPVADEQRVAAAWSMSLDQVRAQAPAAAALLDLCAFLAQDDIPRELPRRDPDRLPAPLAQAARDPLAYNEALRALGRYSLATVTPTALGVHLLVQVVVRARLGPEDERRWGEVAVGLLHESFPDRSWEVATWPACQRLLPHVLAAAEHTERLRVGGEHSGWLLDRAIHAWPPSAAIWAASCVTLGICLGRGRS